MIGVGIVYKSDADVAVNIDLIHKVLNKSEFIYIYQYLDFKFGTNFILTI